MSVRIRVKLGEVEIECEGSEAFVKTELLDLARDLIRLGGGAVSAESAPDVDAVVDALATAPAVETTELAGSTPAVGAPAPSPAARVRLSMSEVADKLESKSGSDLLVAAAAYHTFVLGLPTFDRGDLLVTMRQAPEHYKRSYTNNLSGYIATLLKRDVFVEVEADVYALSTDTREELAAGLGGISD